MKKLIFCLMMLGLVSQAEAQQCKDTKKSNKSKKTAVAKKRTAAKKSVAKKPTKTVVAPVVATKTTLPAIIIVTESSRNNGTTGITETTLPSSYSFRNRETTPAVPLRNSLIFLDSGTGMETVSPWAGFSEDIRETREQSTAIPLPEFRDVATPEGMDLRGEGQIPHRNIDMRGTNPGQNSFEQDMEILNRHDKLRGKQLR
jgi:hypothetical protein